jgi:hypothetical protein
MNSLITHDPLVWGLNPTTCRKCGLLVQYTKSVSNYTSVNGLVCKESK